MEPKTGAILAMASYPTFDPNRYIGIDEKLFRNPAVNEQYEPGSVMKVVTLASGLDLGVVTSRWSYNDTGIFYVGGIPITNHDGSAHGPSTLTDILAHSLNTGAATISKLMFADPFHRYMSNFGFGKASGVDLPAEAPGLLHSPNSADWCEADLGTNSFGQGVSVTPLQMVNAIAAIANGGKLMRPYVVQEIHHDDQVSKTEPKEINLFSVKDKEVAATVSRLAEEARLQHKALEELQNRVLDYEAAEMRANATTAQGIAFVTRAFPERDQEEVRRLALRLIEREKTVALLGIAGAKSRLILARSPDLAIDMAQLLREIGRVFGGGGGGQPQLAQGGGMDATRLAAALEWATARCQEAIGNHLAGGAKQ